MIFQMITAIPLSYLNFKNRFGDELSKESGLRDATEGREMELRRENASLRYILGRQTILSLFSNTRHFSLANSTFSLVSFRIILSHFRDANSRLTADRLRVTESSQMDAATWSKVRSI